MAHIWETCTECNGIGRIDMMCHGAAGCCLYPCNDCGGKGKVIASSTAALLEVKDGYGWAIDGDDKEKEMILAPGDDYAQDRACLIAFDRLKARISPNNWLDWDYGESHPYHHKQQTAGGLVIQ